MDQDCYMNGCDRKFITFDIFVLKTDKMPNEYFYCRYHQVDIDQTLNFYNFNTSNDPWVRYKLERARYKRKV